MLTLILLVVLGGGVGILAVSMAEPKPAMRGMGSRRARAAEDTSTGPSTDPEFHVDAPPEAQPQTPTPAPLRRTTIGLPMRDRRGSVPAAQTAVEGSLHRLVRPSIPRRVLSLVGIAAITVVVGIGIAAIFGAVVGAAAEILGNAIG